MARSLVADGQPRGRDFRPLIPAALTARLLQQTWHSRALEWPIRRRPESTRRPPYREPRPIWTSAYRYRSCWRGRALPGSRDGGHLSHAILGQYDDAARRWEEYHQRNRPSLPTNNVQ
jgi:hypothetical protein